MRLLISILGAVSIGLSAPGAEETEPKFAPLRTQANWEAGQIEEGYSRDESRRVDRELINHATVWALQEIRLADNAKAFMGVGAAYFFVFPRNLGLNPYTFSKRSGVGLTDAHGEFEFFRGQEEGDHGLLLKAGIFPYKYNPDAQNLGEYMFRTWTYPTIITTGGLEFVGTAGVQLSGVSAGTRLGGFSNELLLTIQSDRAPIFGLSLTDIVSYSMGGIFTLGAGIMLDNFYNPEEDILSPKKSANNHYYTLTDGRKMSGKEYADLRDAGALPAATIVDTSYYTFAGQKAMVRASLDFGKMFSSSLLSEQDLRLYFEATLLGIKDYPAFYEKPGDRTVYMAGLNLPTFRLLDLLAIEGEYCSNPFPNSTQGPLGDGSAVPHLDNTYPALPVPVRGDDVKWSLVARKKVYQGFTVHAQAANDHIRMLDVFSTPHFNDFLKERAHWYWLVKLSYSI